MTVPVFVCVPCQSWIMSLNDRMEGDAPWQPQPVGILAQFSDVALEDGEKVERDLGRPVRYLSRRVKADDDGKVGSVIAIVIECGTYEEAAALPGFCPLGEWTGAYAWPREVTV